MSTQPARTIPYYQTGRQQCYRNKRSRDAILSCRVINGGSCTHSRKLADITTPRSLPPKKAVLVQHLSKSSSSPPQLLGGRCCNYDNDNGHSGDVSDSDGSSGGGGDSGRGGVKL
ncbi:hypothetical protein EDB87DRAFT_1574876 [Lactarius vividus]|nr:hypothetical protein EDB87DRAFT_1574876 [Lactarius vividus]